MIEGFAAFAAHEFELAAPLSDGLPLREHLVSIWWQTGTEPAMLADAPALPHGCSQLWADFLHMHERRGCSSDRPDRITDVGIDAWQRVHGVRLPSWQIAAITAADNAYLSQYAKGVKHGD